MPLFLLAQSVSDLKWNKHKTKQNNKKVQLYVQTLRKGLVVLCCLPEEQGRYVKNYIRR